MEKEQITTKRDLGPISNGKVREGVFPTHHQTILQTPAGCPTIQLIMFWHYASSPCVCAKAVLSCPTLCNPTACSPPGSSVHRILQARILGWVAISSSRESSWLRDWTQVSYISCTGRQVSITRATWEAFYVPRGSIIPNKLRTLSYQMHPTSFRWQSQAQVITCALDQPVIDLRTPVLGSINLLEVLTELKEKSLLTRLLTYY